MKICFIGPANSAHLIKWCKWFSENGHEIHVVSFSDGTIENCTVHQIKLGVNFAGSDIEKIQYLFTGRKLKQMIDTIKPDVVSTHYATSYGAALALSGTKRYLLSVWGSDIFKFPQKSVFHKKLLEYSLGKAPFLLSTSKAMAKEASKYTNKPFEITPFGVNLEVFSPEKRTREVSDGRFVVGTVKTMSDTYGIKYLLEACSLFKAKNSNVQLEIRLAGNGPQLDEYKELAQKLDLGQETLFLGSISQTEAAYEWANMDIAIIPSISESFGVAAIEAEASQTPVIISDAEGLLESTLPGETSIVTPRYDSQAIAEAMTLLYRDVELRRKMGEAARRFVTERYEINACFEKIYQIFEKFAGKQ